MNSIYTGILASLAAVALTLSLLPSAEDVITNARQVCHTDTECEALYPEIADELNHRPY